VQLAAPAVDDHGRDVARACLERGGGDPGPREREGVGAVETSGGEGVALSEAAGNAEGAAGSKLTVNRSVRQWFPTTVTASGGCKVPLYGPVRGWFLTVDRDGRNTDRGSRSSSRGARPGLCRRPGCGGCAMVLLILSLAVALLLPAVVPILALLLWILPRAAHGEGGGSSALLSLFPIQQRFEAAE
jgi:hypothetical protein